MTCLPGWVLSQTVEMTRINNAGLLWHLKGCDKIRPFWGVIYFEILKAELEENSGPRIASFCFVFFFGKRNHKRFRKWCFRTCLRSKCFELSVVLDRAL